MTKIAKKYCIISVILAISYSVLILVIPYPRKSNAIFWLAWAMGLIFILAQPFIAYYGLKDSKTIKSKIFGWPIIRLGYLSLIIQLILTLIFLIVGAFIAIPIWILVIIEVILISFTIIGLLVKDTYREEIENMDKNAPITIKFINDLKTDSEILSKRITTDEIHLKLLEFAEEVRYSDPVSLETLTEIEDEINRKYITMKENILNNSLENVIDEINELLQLLRERNLINKREKQ